MVIYEVHIGTATPEGTFEAFIEKLPHLKSLGVNTIELCPWRLPRHSQLGHTMGRPIRPRQHLRRPQGLERLVGAAHAHGIAVLLDVVYNHLGPSGNTCAISAAPTSPRPRRTVG